MINIDNIVTLSESVEIEELTEGHTAYGVYTVAKTVFEKLNVPFVNREGNEIKSQVFYNYGKNGSIDGVKHASLKGVTFTDADVEMFVAKMIAKAAR